MNLKFINTSYITYSYLYPKEKSYEKVYKPQLQKFYNIPSSLFMHTLYFLEDTCLKKIFHISDMHENFHRYAIWKGKLKIISSKINCKIYQTAQERFFSNFTVILY